MLEDVLGAVRLPMGIAASLGSNGSNELADVALVQKRLHALGYFSDANFALESQAAPAASTTPRRRMPLSSPARRGSVASCVPAMILLSCVAQDVAHAAEHHVLAASVSVSGRRRLINCRS